MFLFCVLINKAFAITKRFVILNAERERIRNTLKKETDCHSRLHISPAGSVGASASQRCPPDTRTFAMTRARERIAARLTAYDGRVISAISQKPLKIRLNVIIFAIYNDNFNNFITKVLNV